MHVGSPPQAKRFSALVKHSLQAACRQLAVRGFTLCLRDWILTTLAYNRENNSLVLVNGFHWGIKKKQNRGR
jgi:hypothetical protein